MATAAPTIEAIRNLQRTLSQWLVRTPVIRCPSLEHGTGAEVYAKLEFLQRTSTFKPRGALSVLLELSAARRAAGVTAVSAGNHAIATAYAARVVGTHAKVVMLRSASPLRVARCRHFGADVVLAHDVHDAFARAERIEAEEGRSLVHPFEGPRTTLGTATVGLEICEDVPDFDAVLVPIGGGGLCSGVAAAAKQLNPRCSVFGIEPRGADTMHRSFASGEPRGIERVNTIADSLGAPFALPYSFALCRQFVDELIMVDDDQLRAAMRFLFLEMKLAVEPACAAGTAALLGPLAERLCGRKVVVLLCGSNIDWQTWQQQAYPELPRVA